MRIAASIDLTATSFEILDEDGEVMQRFDLFADETEVAVAELSKAFGSDPAIGEFDVGFDGPLRTTYTWGGFQLQDTNLEPSFAEAAAYFIVVTSAEVGGVEIRGAGGAVVGAGASIAGTSHRDWVDDGGGSPVHFYLFGQTVVDGIPYADYQPAALSVRVWADPSTDLITRIDTPLRNWGA